MGCIFSARYLFIYIVVAPHRNAATISRISPLSIDTFQLEGFPAKTRYAPIKARIKPDIFAIPSLSLSKKNAPIATTKGEKFTSIAAREALV